jgi:hypothetical protein
LIIGVNGEEHAFPRQIEQALNAIEESDVARLTLIRDGVRLQVAISGESLKQLREARGMFDLLRVPRP